MNTWRAIYSGALPAPENMAIDQAILTSHAQGKSPPTLRIYQWSTPTLSLGYFQKCRAIDMATCERLGISVVRRITGGRAVLHFNDLTYAVMAGTEDGIPHSVAGAYRLICEGLLSAFHSLGVMAAIGAHSDRAFRSDNCFLTSTGGDILYQGKKFLGSAQTWQGDSMLQHGSIVLEPHYETWAALDGRPTGSLSDTDSLKRDMTSIKEILGYVPEVNQMIGAIKSEMARVLGVQFDEGRLSADEQNLADQIAHKTI